MHQPQQCPEHQRLVDFGLGKLRPDELAKIEDQLDHCVYCEQCSDTLLNLQDDTFTALVRSLPEYRGPSVAGHDPSPTEDASDSIESSPAADTEPVSLEASEAGTTVRGTGAGEDESRHAATVLIRSGEPVDESELPAELRDHPRYKVLERIGQGGMGQVYRAQHRLMNRPVALKLISSQLTKHPQAVERFRREVQAAAQLHHSNIVTAFDAEQAGDVHFLAMEFVDGTDLSDIVRKRGPLPVDEACEYIRQAAIGLQHAHEKGMVHRDIKPHNLMLVEGRGAKAPLQEPDTNFDDSSGSRFSAPSTHPSIKILDFGLAGFATEAVSLEFDEAHEPADADTIALQLTKMGSVMGTPDYIAPEQARDAHSADIRADIYSLGCTLHFLLTGKPPFEADSVVDKLKAHAESERPKLSEVRDDVPPHVEAVLLKMLAKDPDDRYQDPAEVVDVLTKLLDQRIDEKLCELGLAGSADQPPTASESLPHGEARRWLQSPANGLIATAVAGLLSFLATPAVLDVWRFETQIWPWNLWLITTGFLLIPLSLLMIQGGLRMRNAESYRWTWWTAVAGLLPLSPVSWPLGVFFGIWSLAVLRRPAIQAEFAVSPNASTRLPHWLYTFATLTVVGYLAVSVAAAGVLYFETDYGVVRVTVEDPSLEVTINGQTVTLHDKDNPLTIRAGEQKLIVRQNDSDFELVTDSFQLRRGGRIEFRVDLLPGKVVVSQDGQPFDAKALPASSPAGDPALRQSLAGLVDVARDELDESEAKQWLEKEAPLVLQTLGLPAAHRALQLLAGLPASSHERLLKDGYLRWRPDQLDEPRRTLYADVLGRYVEWAGTQGLTGNQPPEELTETLLASADTGFSVVDIPDPDGAMICWCVIAREGLPIPASFPLIGMPAEIEKAHGQELLVAQADRLRDLRDQPSSPPPLVNAADAEFQRLRGQWIARSATASGKTASERNLGDFVVEFLSNNTVRIGDATKPTEFIYEINPWATPATIDLRPLDDKQDRVLQGLYELTDDELLLAIAFGGSNRPQRLASVEGDSHQLIQLQRVDLTEDRLKELVSAAAGITLDQMHVLANAPAGSRPSIEAFDSKTLTAWLLSIDPQKEAEKNSDAARDFRFLDGETAQT